jgi:hypothetical protein
VDKTMVGMIGTRLVVTEPASDLSLLTVQERRAAAGVSDEEHDADLAAMDLRVAAAIAEECNIAVGIGGDPTLRRETVTETFRNVRSDCIIFARRHGIEVTSITIDGSALDDAEYEIDPETGICRRLSGDHFVDLCASKIVAVYDAGFATIPTALKGAATDCLQSYWARAKIDPSIKTYEDDVEGIGRVRTDYFAVSSAGNYVQSAGIPDIAIGQLKRFRNPPRQKS